MPHPWRKIGETFLKLTRPPTSKKRRKGGKNEKGIFKGFRY